MGLPQCVAEKCSHNYKTCRMHRFPLNQSKRTQWIANLRKNPKFTLKDHHRLCACHFEKCMFQEERDREILIPTATPTIFPTHTIKLKGATTRSHRKPLGDIDSHLNIQANKGVSSVNSIHNADANLNRNANPSMNQNASLNPNTDTHMNTNSVPNQDCNAKTENLMDFLKSQNIDLDDVPEISQYINCSSNSLFTSASDEDGEDSMFYLLNDGDANVLLPSDFLETEIIGPSDVDDFIATTSADASVKAGDANLDNNARKIVTDESSPTLEERNVHMDNDEQPPPVTIDANLNPLTLDETDGNTDAEEQPASVDYITVSKDLLDSLQKEKEEQRKEIYRLRKKQTQANRMLKHFREDELKRLTTEKIKQWSRETLQKALQIRFAVGKRGYEFLLQKGYPLPSYSTLCRRVQKLPLTCGVSKKIAYLLKQKAASLVSVERNCVLSFDEMEIHKGMEYDKGQHKVIGKATIGDKTKLASKLLLLVARGITTNWKQVIGWHLTPSTCPSKEDLWSFLLDGLRCMESANYHTWGVISDMGSGNRRMWTMAGSSATKGAATQKGKNGKKSAGTTARKRAATQKGKTSKKSTENVNAMAATTAADGVATQENENDQETAEEDTSKTRIPHPFRKNEELYFFFDNPHLLKNLKSSFLTHNFTLSKTIVEKYKLSSPTISSHWLREFVTLQNRPDVIFKPAPFLTDAILNPSQYEKMRVGYATAIFNEKVTAGMETAVLTGLLSAEAQTTVWFMKQVVGWFNVVSGRQIKRSITRKNFSRKKEILENFNEILEELKAFDNRWKPWQTGIIINNNNLLHMAEKLLFSKKINYFLGARVSQDGIENIFSQIRRRGNRMPPPLQALRAVRLLCVSQFTGESKFSNYADAKDRPHLDFLKSPFKRSPRKTPSKRTPRPKPSSASPKNSSQGTAKRPKNDSVNPPRALFANVSNSSNDSEGIETCQLLAEELHNLPGPSSDINKTDQLGADQFTPVAVHNLLDPNQSELVPFLPGGLQSLPGPSCSKRDREDDEESEEGENESDEELEEERRICEQLSNILDITLEADVDKLDPLEKASLNNSIGYFIRCTRRFGCKKKCKYLHAEIRNESILTAYLDKGGLIYAPEPVRILGKRLEALCRERMKIMEDFSLTEIGGMIKSIIDNYGNNLCKCKFFEKFCEKFIRSRMYFKLDNIKKTIAGVKRARKSKKNYGTASTTLRS